MVNKQDSITLQQGNANPSARLPLLLFGLCGLRDDDRVFISGFDGVHALRGWLKYPQAVEFLASYIQPDKGYADGYQGK